MFDRMHRFFSLRTLDKLNCLMIIFWKIKSYCVYRPFFGSFGSKSFLAKPILLARPDRIFIGDRVAIRQGARIEVIQSNPSRVPTLEIGHDTNIEQNVHIVCHGKIHIGNKVSITANCAIVDLSHDLKPADPFQTFGAAILDEDSWVDIEDEVFLGIGVVVLPNVRIGRGAIIGANSVVTQDVPAHAIAAGAPATVRRFYRVAEAARDYGAIRTLHYHGEE